MEHKSSTPDKLQGVQQYPLEFNMGGGGISDTGLRQLETVLKNGSPKSEAGEGGSSSSQVCSSNATSTTTKSSKSPVKREQRNAILEVLEPAEEARTYGTIIQDIFPHIEYLIPQITLEQAEKLLNFLQGDRLFQDNKIVSKNAGKKNRFSVYYLRLKKDLTNEKSSLFPQSPQEKYPTDPLVNSTNMNISQPTAALLGNPTSFSVFQPMVVPVDSLETRSLNFPEMPSSSSAIITPNVLQVNYDPENKHLKKLITPKQALNGSSSFLEGSTRKLLIDTPPVVIESASIVSQIVNPLKNQIEKSKSVTDLATLAQQTNTTAVTVVPVKRNLVQAAKKATHQSEKLL
jgi:hypothetical protein